MSLYKVNRCCCGCGPVTIGAQIFAGLFILSGLASIISFAVFAYEDAWYETAAGIAFFAMQVLVGLLVFLAVAKKRAALMLPIVVVSFLNLLALIAYLVFAVIDLCSKTHDSATVIGTIVACVLVFVVQCWVFLLYFDTYRTLRDIHRF